MKQNCRKWYDIKAAINEQESNQIYIYGDIGDSWDENSVSASAFIKELSNIEPHSPIDLHINSGGGDVFDAAAIFTAIKAHKGTVTAYVDGLAASAATYIAMAADKIVMGESAYFMIHNAWTFAAGNSHDFADIIVQLNRIDSNLMKAYAKKTGKKDVEVEASMAATTWFTASEALEYGLVDEVAQEEMKAAACITNEQVSKYKNVPETLELASGTEVKEQVTPIIELDTEDDDVVAGAMIGSDQGSQSVFINGRYIHY